MIYTYREPVAEPLLPKPPAIPCELFSSVKQFFRRKVRRVVSVFPVKGRGKVLYDIDAAHSLVGTAAQLSVHSTNFNTYRQNGGHRRVTTTATSHSTSQQINTERVVRIKLYIVKCLRKPHRVWLLAELTG